MVTLEESCAVQICKDCDWIAVASVEHYAVYSDLAEYTVVWSNFLQARNLQYVDFASQGETP